MPRLISAKVITYFFLLLIFDVSILPFLQMGLFRPIFLYLMVVYAAYEWHWTQSIPAALMAGVLRDSVSSQSFGIETSSLVLAAFGLNVFVRKVETGFLPIRMLVAFLFVFGVCLTVLTLTSLLQENLYFSWDYLGGSFSSAACSALVMPFFVYLTRRWFRERIPLKQPIYPK